MAENAVMDVTFAEQIEKPRESYQDGLDLGLEFSGHRIAQLTLDLSVCRTELVKARTDSESRERLLQHWKSETDWWREEHDRVHAEYCAFVKEMARRFAK